MGVYATTKATRPDPNNDRSGNEFGCFKWRDTFYYVYFSPFATKFVCLYMFVYVASVTHFAIYINESNICPFNEAHKPQHG